MATTARTLEGQAMTEILPLGAHVRVRVPASSANLGAGFDSLGLALGIYDEIAVTTIETGLEVDVAGEGSGDVPLNSSHLVVRAVERGLEAAGVWATGLRVTCDNSIPHSRGLGSSAAAAVGGLVAANALIARELVDHTMPVSRVLQLASEFEGHPDNAAASIHGGATVSWSDTCGPDRCYSAAPLMVHPDIRAYVFVPSHRSSTSEARGLLPAEVAHPVAAFNAGRAAVMVVALTQSPDLLLEGTEDLLHQPYRVSAMPQSTEFMHWLRERGIAAAISGAGPSVLALTTEPLADDVALAAHERGLSMRAVEIAPGAGRIG